MLGQLDRLTIVPAMDLLMTRSGKYLARERPIPDLVRDVECGTEMDF